MRTFVLTFAIINLLSAGAYASQRGYDLRDTQQWTSNGTPNAINNSHTTSVDNAALAAGNNASTTTAFERMMEISVENSDGRH